MKKLMVLIDRFFQRFMPDPFVIAALLTLFTFGLAIVFRAERQVPPFAAAAEIIQYWGDGFWDLAKFTLQMAMILIGGYVVAISRPVKAFLLSMIKRIRSPAAAVIFCTFATMIASWINWGFGLVIGGIVALEVGKQLSQVPFRVLVASSYSGFLVWHAGLSGSIPLAVNTPDGFSEQLIGGLIPPSETIFSTFNLTALAALVLLLPTVNVMFLKMAGPNTSRLDEEGIATKAIVLNDNENWLNNSFVVVGLMFAMVGFYWYSLWADQERSLSLDLNSINLMFFMVGLLLHGTPRNFVDAVTEATPKVAPILIQYPLYAAIMAVLIKSGMAAQISQMFVDYSNQDTFPLMTFYSAGLLNMFVPSGGGQWAVQAPIVITAAKEMDVDLARVTMAVAWGDAWTNMAQPFWAIPLLTIAGLKIKDIIGFCLVILFASGVVLSLLFLLI